MMQKDSMMSSISDESAEDQLDAKFCQVQENELDDSLVMKPSKNFLVFEDRDGFEGRKSVVEKHSDVGITEFLGKNPNFW